MSPKPAPLVGVKKTVAIYICGADKNVVVEWRKIPMIVYGYVGVHAVSATRASKDAGSTRWRVTCVKSGGKIRDFDTMDQAIAAAQLLGADPMMHPSIVNWDMTEENKTRARARVDEVAASITASHPAPKKMAIRRAKRT